MKLDENRKTNLEGVEDAFERHQPLLFSIAYRMLGSVADAEDIVQEAFIRLQRVDAREVRSERDYLCAVVTRLCIDHLRSARVRREQYVGPWLPEPLLTPADADPLDHAILAESLSTAFLLMLERLSEVERAVYLLREVFSFDYEAIAGIVGKTAPACRQIVRRARERMARDESRFAASSEDAERITGRFLESCASGDLAGLLELLTDDVVAWTDGGGKVVAARNVVRGRDRVGRFCIGVVRKWAGSRVRTVVVNGAPWMLVSGPDGVPRVVSFHLHEGRIAGIYAVMTPEKLTRVPRELLPLDWAPGGEAGGAAAGTATATATALPRRREGREGNATDASHV